MTLYSNFFVSVFTLTLISNLTVFASDKVQGSSLTEHQLWLKDRFSEQHNQLIPVVAVADIFFACNQSDKNSTDEYLLNDLITKTDKLVLAEKLKNCLVDEAINSEVAIDYGLLGCFYDQLNNLSTNEKAERMKLVKKAIASLPFEDKKKSFTQCVTEQAITYLT